MKGRIGSIVKSLRFRLTMWNTLVVLLVAAGALVSVREGLRLTLRAETDEVLKTEAGEILLAVEQILPDRASIIEELNRKTAVHREHGWFVQLIDNEGDFNWASSGAPPALLDDSLLPPKRAALFWAGSYRVAQRWLDKPGMPKFVVRVGTSTEFIEQDVAQVTRRMAPLGLVVLLLAPLGGSVLAGRAIRPLRKLIVATENLRPSRMEERLPIRGSGDELDQLSEKINHFLDQIADHLRRDREFVANAAHELRSPLAAIQSSVEIALSKERTTADYEDLLASIDEQCGDLGILVNQLLLLAENEARGNDLEKEAIALDDVVRQSLDMFQGVAEERSIRLKAYIRPSVVVLGERSRLRQMVNNLMDNAIKFTPAGGIVTVELRKQGNEEAVLTIADTGIGIAAQELARIFDRFYQVDRARQRLDHARGNGLGLSICNAIVAIHGGHIGVMSERGCGSTFTVTLPAASLWRMVQHEPAST